MRSLNDAEAFEFYRQFLAFLGVWLKPDSYLEIGLAGGTTFRRMVPYCASMHGVDPNPPPLGDLPAHCQVFPMRSDDYFGSLTPDARFDLVFIDGDHAHQQVMRDVRNALARLAPGGIIAAHDMAPPSLDHVAPMNCGDAYKAAIELRQDPDLEVYTLPVRFGVTLIGKVGTEFPWVHA